MRKLVLMLALASLSATAPGNAASCLAASQMPVDTGPPRCVVDLEPGIHRFQADFYAAPVRGQATVEVFLPDGTSVWRTSCHYEVDHVGAWSTFGCSGHYDFDHFSGPAYSSTQPLRAGLTIGGRVFLPRGGRLVASADEGTGVLELETHRD